VFGLQLAQMPRVLQELDHAASTWYQHQENQTAMKAKHKGNQEGKLHLDS
jgi:hypothetical protein